VNLLSKKLHVSLKVIHKSKILISKSRCKFMASPSAKCRICSCDFKIQFGTTAGKDQHKSSENLFLPSKRRECFGTILAAIIESVGLQVPNDPSRYSSRVCNKCARKIRNLGHIYSELKSSLEVHNNNLSTPNKENVAATKRLLNTPQGNSPCRKAVRVNSPASKLSSRKSLSFARRDNTEEERLDAALHIENLPDEGDLHVKVAFVANGELIARIPRDMPSKLLVKQLALKKWKSASNTILQHKELLEEVQDKILKETSKELKEYLKEESILLLRDPDEIGGFSNTIFLRELRMFCPMFYAFMLSAAGLEEEDALMTGSSANSIALAAATICREVNVTASALHYRISAVLFHSGVKNADLVRLNRLGVSMSPNAMLSAQTKMVSQLEGKVLIWKQEVEQNMQALLLGEEIQQEQLPAMPSEDNMAIDLDFSQVTLENYDNFTIQGYSLLMKELDGAKQKLNEPSYSELCLAEAVSKLRTTKLPLFRYVHATVCLMAFQNFTTHRLLGPQLFRTVNGILYVTHM